MVFFFFITIFVEVLKKTTPVICGLHIDEFEDVTVKSWDVRVFKGTSHLSPDWLERILIGNPYETTSTPNPEVFCRCENVFIDSGELMIGFTWVNLLVDLVP